MGNGERVFNERVINSSPRTLLMNKNQSHTWAKSVNWLSLRDSGNLQKVRQPMKKERFYFNRLLFENGKG